MQGDPILGRKGQKRGQRAGPEPRRTGALDGACRSLPARCRPRLARGSCAGPAWRPSGWAEWAEWAERAERVGQLSARVERAG